MTRQQGLWTAILWSDFAVEKITGKVRLKDVAVELRPGEVVLLRGANGSGKTTLLNILTENLVPDQAFIAILAHMK